MGNFKKNKISSKPLEGSRLSSLNSTNSLNASDPLDGEAFVSSEARPWRHEPRVLRQTNPLVEKNTETIKLHRLIKHYRSDQNLLGSLNPYWDLASDSRDAIQPRLDGQQSYLTDRKKGE
jgi:hypothetical protein